MECESKCPACLLPLDTTMELSCGHTFCKTCFEKIKTLTTTPNRDSDPLCPVCGAPFKADASAESSAYYDRIAQHCNPEASRTCQDCELTSASFFCETKCGYMCTVCHSLHSQHPVKMRHISKPAMQVSGSTSLDPTKCIVHNQTIIAVCKDCWPSVEVCAECAWDHSKTRKGHTLTDLSQIEPESIQHDDLLVDIEQLKEYVKDIRLKSAESLEEISKQESNDVELIRQFYDEVIKKMEALKLETIKKAEEKYVALTSPFQTSIHLCDMLDNIMGYSAELTQESKKLFQGKPLENKLFKSRKFTEHIVNSTVSEFIAVESSPVQPYEISAIRIEFDELKESGSVAKIIVGETAPIAPEGQPSEEEISALEGKIQSLQIQLETANQKIEELTQGGSEIFISNDVEKEEEEEEVENEDYRNQEVDGEDGFDCEEEAVEPCWRADPTNYEFSLCTQNDDSCESLLNFPWAIAANPRDMLFYVTEQYNNRIVFLDDNLQIVGHFGQEGDGPGEFSQPLGIAVSRAGLIAVSEKDGNRVQIFDENFQIIDEISAGHRKSPSCSQYSNYDGFSNPSALCFDGAGNLYVTNNCKNRVDKFNASFDFERSFANGSGKTGVSSPDGICCISSGEVCVVGNGSSDIKFYTPDGNFIRSMPIASINSYVSIVEGPANTIFVSDRATHAIYVYSSDGSCIHKIGSRGSNKAHFEAQKGICFGPDERLYVCDYGNHRLQVFSDN